MTLSAGTRLGRYEILSALGAGGMGEVYRARDTRLDRIVAIKVLPADAAHRAELRERLEREARALSSLNHPHICALYDIGQHKSITFLVMEYVEGETLARRLSQGALPVALTLQYAIEIAAALEAAHGRGVVHRDLKPANITVTRSGAKLIDFGLAEVIASEFEEITRSRVSVAELGVIAGTIPYLSPEVLRGECVGVCSDLWALGIVLHEMVTGELPFRGSTGFALTAAILHEAPAALPASVPIALGAIIKRCLDKDPSRRYSHAGEVRAALEAVQSDPTIAPPPPAVPHNLPIQLTRFVGRQAEIREVTERLANERLVTLTGAGGSGKTRLALEAARDLVPTFGHGVWLVELGSLSDPEMIPQSVAAILGVQEEPGRAVTQTLTEYLRHRAVLLVLDNCEHLIGACAQLANALLMVCPRLKILTTSREPLAIGGEHAWRVPSLSLPDRHSPLAPDGPSCGDAIDLFVDRARVVSPTFTLTSENIRAVAEICYRLDGIPLAIELAAARISVLTVEEIAARLDDRFRLLTSGNRVAVPRQQTLRATIDWSYDLLAPDERRLLCRLSVFTGGWTLEAAEQVCADEILEPEEMLDLLSRLVDKSLVIVDDDSAVGRRYRLLEIVRQYSRERLPELEVARVRERHAAFYSGLAARAEQELRGRDQVKWLDRLQTEHDNLRAALEWHQAGRDVGEISLAFAGALWWFWLKRGYISEGRYWLGRALSSGTGTATTSRAKALLGAGVLAYFQGDYGSAESSLEEGVGLAEAVREPWVTGMSLFVLGFMAGERGDYERATSLADQCLDISRTVQDPWMGAHPHELMGLIALYQDDYERAQSCFENGAVLIRQAGDKWMLAMLLCNLGDVADRQGDFARAGALAEEEMMLCHELGDNRGIVWALEILARAAASQGSAERASRLGGAANALMEMIGVQLAPTLRGPHERYLGSVRAALGDELFAAAWAEGRKMTVPQILAYALAHEEGLEIV